MNANAVRVKICGITTPSDARLAAEAGADAVGLNFLAGPRKIDVPTAGAILDALPRDVEAWALFDVGGPDLPEPLRRVTAGGRITRVQMYGRLSPETVAQLRDCGLETVAVRYANQPGQLAGTSDWLAQFGDGRPAMLLLDTGGSTQPGGTGRTWDWSIIADMRRSGQMDDWPPIVLAGGLTPDNVAEAIRTVRPAWVDTCSGVEQSPGMKDSTKMQEFVQAAKSVVL